MPLRVTQCETPKTSENTVLSFSLTLVVVDVDWGQTNLGETGCLGEKPAEGKSPAGASGQRGPQEPRAYPCALPGLA